MFYKIDVLKDFAKFTGKHLYWSLFLIKRDFIKKKTPTQVFFWKHLRIAFFLKSEIKTIFVTQLVKQK